MKNSPTADGGMSMSTQSSSAFLPRARLRGCSLLAFVLATFFPAPLLAQATPPRISFRSITVADGLSQDDIWAIFQDSLGFVWLGTEDGLDRYDGRTFRSFKPLAFDTTSLAHPWIYGLAPAGGADLWVATEGGGLHRYDAESESFTRQRFAAEARISDDLLTLHQARDGSLWLGTRFDGLYHYDPATGHVTPYRLGNEDGPSDTRVTALLEDRQGRIWIGTGKGGLDRLDPRTRTWVRHQHDDLDPSSIPSGAVTALLEDGAGNVWVGTSPGGLSRYLPETQRFRHLTYASGARPRNVRSLFEDPAGALWVGTDDGLDRLDRASSVFAHYRHDPANRNSVLGGMVISMFLDRAGVFWVGTATGVSYFNWDAPPFAHIAHDPANPNSLDDPDVWTMLEDRSGLLWVGTGTGLNRVERSTGKVVRYPADGASAGSLAGDLVMGLHEDAAGDFWVGTRNGALFRFDRATGQVAERFSYDPTNSTSLRTDLPWNMFEDRAGSVWITNGARGCLNRMNRATRTFRHYCHDPNNPNTPAHDIAHDIVEDSTGALWLGTWGGGLDRFDPETGTFTHFRHDPANPNTPASDFILALHQDGAGMLWLGLYGFGLDRFDPVTGTFTHYTSENSELPSDIVLAMEEDDAGDLWLGTYRGLSRLTPVTGRFRNYGIEDGIQDVEFNSSASFRAANGELFFGGVSGVSVFFPDRIRDNPVPPPVVLTGLQVRGMPVQVSDDGPLRSALPFTRSLELRHDQQDVAIRFAALHFIDPDRNRYRYRLEGYDRHWRTGEPEPVATYTNLDPGRYTFRVQASNSDGVWNEEGASLAIVVLPPWWGTWWAYALYGTLTLALLYAVRHYDLNRLRLESRVVIEAAEAAKLRELEHARSRFFANISHEFRTPLTLTLGPLDDLRAGLHGALTPAMTEQVELARRSAGRVLNLIEQILELARLEGGRTRLRARRLDIVAFTRDVAAAFVPLAERKSITFDVNLPPDAIEIYADPAGLEKIFSNLLSNAFKFTPAGRAVRLTIESDQDTARIVVRDSGAGIPAGELPRIFERFHRVENEATAGQPGTGIGLALARELVELHRGSLGAESEVGFGSTFTVTLPLGRAHLTPDQVLPDEATAGWIAGAPVLQETTNGGGEWGVAGGASVESGLSAGEQADVTTVLVVEDNAEVRAYIRKHLAPRYRVLEADDGQRGLEMTRQLLPDLVLSDVMMPGLDGYALCRAIKQDTDTDFIPVILLTARAAPTDRMEGLEGRADDYLTKPFDVPELLARVDNLIMSRRLLRDRFSGVARIELHAARVEVEPADERFLDQVRAAIEKNLADEAFSVERLARAVAHSRGHLHRRLRDLLGESPSDLIRRMRLERAAQLLEAGAGSVSTIAYAVGFKSLSHFSNLFHEQFGVRPSGYRAHRST